MECLILSIRINNKCILVITQYIRETGFNARLSLFYVKFWKLLGGLRNNAYICTAKMLMRYEEGRRCAAVFVSAILFINRPIGAAASGIRKDQVASHQQP